MNSPETDTTLYTAPWIVCLEQPSIKEGGILVHKGRIADVGKHEIISRKHPGVPKIELKGILLPPLINCHIHLELSAFREVKRPLPNSSMVNWIEELLQKRQECSPEKDTIAHALEAARKQYEDGVVLLADIHNDPNFSIPEKSGYPEIYSILELVAPTKKRAEEARDLLNRLSGKIAVSPHAPYSIRTKLITELKKRCLKENLLFSIHIAESKDEREFLEKKCGPFYRFLQKRNSWEEDMLGTRSYKGSIHYLNELSVLDHQTLLVHCVHISDKEIDIIKRSQAKVCLCPGSNEFLHAGFPPLERLLENGVTPAIGTDSFASNESLDMWREMKLLRKHFPRVDPKTIFKMATKAGAVALGREDDYGGLIVGKKAVFLQVYHEKFKNMSEEQLLDQLTLLGRPKELSVVRADLE